MNIEMVIQDNRTGVIYDISELVGDITVETWISGNAGKMTFKFVKSDALPVAFYEGSRVYLKVEGQGVFWGYVFTKARGSDGIISVTAYDQLRYLKNQDTYVFPEPVTSSQIFEKICNDYQLKYKVADASGYKIAPVPHDNKALASIIEDALNKTFAYSGKRYMIRDNFGVLNHVDINSLRTTLIIGDESLLTDYHYESSIDNDTYNQINLVQENKSTGKRDRYIVKDSANIVRWGILQYHERIDENANAVQIKQKAETLLKLHNSVKRKLSLDCLGDFRVFAGAGILLYITDLGDISLNQFAIVSSCRHSLQNNMHLMKLEVEPVWLVKN